MLSWLSDSCCAVSVRPCSQRVGTRGAGRFDKAQTDFGSFPPALLISTTPRPYRVPSSGAVQAPTLSQSLSNDLRAAGIRKRCWSVTCGFPPNLVPPEKSLFEGMVPAASPNFPSVSYVALGRYRAALRPVPCHQAVDHRGGECLHMDPTRKSRDVRFHAAVRGTADIERALRGTRVHA
jgi:hypothetical protein